MIDLIRDEPEELAKIAAEGRRWALKHYSGRNRSPPLRISGSRSGRAARVGPRHCRSWLRREPMRRSRSIGAGCGERHGPKRFARDDGAAQGSVDAGVDFGGLAAHPLPRERTAWCGRCRFHLFSPPFTGRSCIASASRRRDHCPTKRSDCRVFISVFGCRSLRWKIRDSCSFPILSPASRCTVAGYVRCNR